MSARCGRAELLRVLVAQGPDLLNEAAAWLGYEREAGAPVLGLDVGEADADLPRSYRLSATGGTVESAGSQVALSLVVPRPCARFLQLTAVNHFDITTEATVEVPLPPWEADNRGDILDLPESDPLVPWPRLWRRLRRHLSQSLVTHELDIPALLRHVTRVEPLRRLPRLTRARFAAKVRILVDRTRRQLPFWSDQDLVCHALSRWMVADHLRPFYFMDGMNPDEWLDAGAVDFGAGPHGTIVLLLGDLGAYGTSSQSEAWGRAGQWLKDQGAELRALAPCPGWRLDPNIAALWNAVTWDGAERRLPPLSESEQRERSERLLTLVSSALRIEPGLLRDARSLLPTHATDSGTEADVLNHPAVVGQSALGLTLDSEQQQRLREAFQKGSPELTAKLLNTLQHWHQGLPPEILMLERFELMQRLPELFADEQGQKLASDVRKDLIAVLQAIYEQDSARDREVPLGVLAWFRDFELRLPDEVWLNDDELSHALLRAWAVAHRGETEPKTPPGLDSEALSILMRGKAPPPQRYRIWQVGGGLVVLPGEPTYDGGPPRPRPGSEQLPIGSPIAEIVAGATQIVVATPGQRGTPHPIPTALARPIALQEWDGLAQGLLIASDHQELRLEVLEKPDWAKRVGRDAYGLYAEFELKGIRQRMRWIAPGRFLMGSPEGEAERYDDERQHEVELTEGYWMADTACTQALWEAVMRSNPSEFKQDGAGNPTPQRPVEKVSWDDCQGFVKCINEVTPELEFRLPTEAEWEYACRAGTTTPFSFGENITPAQVNYNGEHPYARGAKGENRKETVAVGTLAPNPWGLYEMHGNALEWCEDWFGDYSTGKAVDPKGPTEGQYRVLRGGSWNDIARDARAAGRDYDEPGLRDGCFGFRFVRGRKTASNQESGATGRHGGGEGTEP